jgi:hypothetical protein
MLPSRTYRLYRWAVLLFSLLLGWISLASKSDSSYLTNASSLSLTMFPTHYIVFQISSDGIIHPLAYRRVELNSPLTTLDAEALAFLLHEPTFDTRRLTIALEAKGGEVIYQSIVNVPLWQSGEFLKPNSELNGGQTERHWFSLISSIFVVRLPALANLATNTTLAINDIDHGTVTRFTLELLITQTSQITLSGSISRLASQPFGSPANRVDILVMGDGYTALQNTKFTSDSENVIAEFFNISPLAEYRNYFNINLLFTPSNQSGADHPPYQAGCNSIYCCGDPTMQTDPLQNTFVDTAFDARYCAGNIHQLIGINYEKVFTAAAAMPDWDTILLIVNDDTYGGNGGPVTVISTNEYKGKLAQHEFGHTFAQLADEYEGGYPGLECSDVTGTNPCPINVTDVITRTAIKWSPWISPTTPIPTIPEFDPAFAGVVGLFEGAYYQTTGMYRSGQDCLMRSITASSYCQVPIQAIVLRFYNGGWGTPSSGIELIEPGSATPANPIVTVTYPNSQVFSATVLQPLGGPSVSIQWLINGVVVPGANMPNFTYSPAEDFTDSVQIELRVEDTTAFVHPAMAGNSLQSRNTWTVLSSLTYQPYQVIVTGPGEGFVGESYLFAATVEPITTTLPLTYTWQVSGQPEVTHSSGLTDTVSFIWEMPGTNVISITASNLVGSVMTTNKITIKDVPISGLSASNDSPTLLGEVTTFTATITSGTNVIYTWDFGDGDGENGAVVTHTYSTAGAYTAMVTATNFANTHRTNTHVTIIGPLYDLYLPLVIKSTQSPLAPAPASSLPGSGMLEGLMIVGIVGRWKKNSWRHGNLLEVKRPLEFSKTLWVLY